MIFKTAIQLSLVMLPILLMGCDALKNESVSNICEDFPQFCEDLHKIGDCRYNRTAVIRAQYYDKIKPSEVNKEKLLIQLDEYESCLELLLLIQYSRNKGRKAYIVENYLKTQELMKTHLKESKNTQDPMLAYYLWTRHNDMKAREIFLAAATKKELQDPRLLFKLASVYVKDNPQEALNQFYNAMRLTSSLQQISTSNFAMIMTIFYQNRQFEEAYIWALIALQQDEEDEYPINLDLILRKGLASGPKIIASEEKLQETATLYYKQLSSGKFELEAPLLE